MEIRASDAEAKGLKYKKFILFYKCRTKTTKKKPGRVRKGKRKRKSKRKRGDWVMIFINPNFNPSICNATEGNVIYATS